VVEPPNRKPAPSDKPPIKKLSVMDSGQHSAGPPRAKPKVKVESFDESAAAPAQPDGTPAQPVNAFSNAVDPRKLFPMHFDLLMRDLMKRGETPEHWRVISAEEVRLDEMNFDVEFTLLDQRSKGVTRRRVDVQQGKLQRIVDR
jgi:hypothetical protein